MEISAEKIKIMAINNIADATNDTTMSGQTLETARNHRRRILGADPLTHYTGKGSTSKRQASLDRQERHDFEDSLQPGGGRHTTRTEDGDTMGHHLDPTNLGPPSSHQTTPSPPSHLPSTTHPLTIHPWTLICDKLDPKRLFYLIFIPSSPDKNTKHWTCVGLHAPVRLGHLLPSSKER